MKRRMGARRFGTLAVLTCLALARVAQAGPLDVGTREYKSGQYAQAAASFQQAVGQTQGSERAKAYYQLGNAYHRLHQDPQALDAYQHAVQIDPQKSFASSPEKFDEAVARVSGGAPVTARQRRGGLTGDAVPAGRDPAYQTLTTSNVYVDPRLTSINSGQLEQAALQSQGNPHTVVKIAVLGSLPGNFRSVGQYAGLLHRNLALGKNGLVVDVLGGPTQGVAVVTTGLSESEDAHLAQQYGPQIAASPTTGTAALAQAVAGDINSHEYRGAAVLWIIFIIAVVAVAVLLASASRQRRQRIAVSARQPVDALRANVLSGIEYIDGYADVLPKNNPDSDQVRAFRQSADGKYEQAAKILGQATEVSDIQRAQGLLQGAQADVQQARRYLDRATGGTGNIPGDDAVRPQPLPENEQQVQAVPQDQRGVSFFSSQPAPLGSLVPVTVTVNGQSRQVLATPAEAEELRQGRMPQVRAFSVNGQYVPWYEYNSYDPYRDYWQYQNSGWGGFGGGVAAGLVGAELLGDLFAPRGYGYGGFGYGGYGYGTPFAFSPDNDYYRGYYDAEQQERAAAGSFGGQGYGGPGYDNTGSGSFLGSSGPGYDTQNYDNAGSASFMTDGGGYGGGGDRS